MFAPDCATMRVAFKNAPALFGNLYPSPGYCGEIIRIWACRVAQKGEMHLDEDEFLEVERIPLDKAVEMVLNNEIPDSKTQVGILKTAALVKAGKL